MELRHFDRDDWSAFAGCESESPLIAYSETFTLVVDDTYVEIYLAGDYGVRLTGNLTWKFPDRGTAMLFALSVRGTEPSDIMDLKADVYGGRSVG